MSKGPSPAELDALGECAKADLARLVEVGHLDTVTRQVGSEAVEGVTLEAAARSLPGALQQHFLKLSARYQTYYRGQKLIDSLAVALPRVGVKVHSFASEDTAKGERLVALADLGEDLARRRAEHRQHHGPWVSPLADLTTPFERRQPS